jgi:glycosyltransferase involved in cell wall biosynthesis
MKRVIIGTPAHDGKVDVHYTISLIETIKLCHDVEIYPIFMSYDSLIQRARNDLIKMAIESDVDDIIFIDADQGWNPTDIFKLLNHPVDVVGGLVPKKSEEIGFNVKILPDSLTINADGLMEVEYIGTGFLRLSRKVMHAVWDSCTPYTNNGTECRMVFDLQIIDGELVSEDNIFCKKCKDLGFKVFIDPEINCDHIGVKKYSVNFLHFLEELK